MRNENDNIIDMKRQKPPSPPLINLPPITKMMLGIILAVHLGLLIPGIPADVIISQLGFIPARYTVMMEQGIFDPAMLWSPITYMMAHSGWTHVLMNAAMLAAFGAGLERAMGARIFIEFTVLGGLFGALTQMLVFPTSQIVMIGASGAISAQFAAILLVMQAQGRLPTSQYGIWPFAGFWIGISLFFAGVDGFSAGGIAWAAHLGGFIGAMALLRYKKERYLP